MTELLLRNVVSHATGGTVQDCTGMSLNDIGVAISAHHNVIWKHAQEAAQRQPDPALAAMRRIVVGFREALTNGERNRDNQLSINHDELRALIELARAALAAPGKGES